MLLGAREGRCANGGFRGQLGRLSYGFWAGRFSNLAEQGPERFLSYEKGTNDYAYHVIQALPVLCLLFLCTLGVSLWAQIFFDQKKKPA